MKNRLNMMSADNMVWWYVQQVFDRRYAVYKGLDDEECMQKLAEFILKLTHWCKI
jgi:hypothetical protein